MPPIEVKQQMCAVYEVSEMRKWYGVSVGAAYSVAELDSLCSYPNFSKR